MVKSCNNNGLSPLFLFHHLPSDSSSFSFFVQVVPFEACAVVHLAPLSESLFCADEANGKSQLESAMIIMCKMKLCFYVLNLELAQLCGRPLFFFFYHICRLENSFISEPIAGNMTALAILQNKSHRKRR